MSPSSSEDITVLLAAWPNPDADAKLMPLIYEELRRIAGAYFRHERPNHTLQPTALLHEGYIRLTQSGRRSWKNRAHFFGAAACAMRRILIEHARRHRAAKRGGSLQRIDWDRALAYEPQKARELLALDEALIRLEELDPRQSHIVELRFFGGLSIRETAEVLGVGVTTVKTEWAVAKAWLKRELDENAP